MCGATEGGLSLDGVNVAKEADHPGPGRPRDASASSRCGNAYVRLLDRTGEFTAEVPTSATGHFRFFAGDGEWTLRTLAPKAEVVDTEGHRRRSARVAEVGHRRLTADPLRRLPRVAPLTRPKFRAVSALADSSGGSAGSACRGRG